MLTLKIKQVGDDFILLQQIKNHPFLNFPSLSRSSPLYENRCPID